MNLLYSRKLADKLNEIFSVREDWGKLNLDLFYLCESEVPVTAELWDLVEKSVVATATEKDLEYKNEMKMYFLLSIILDNSGKLNKFAEIALHEVAFESKIFQSADFAENPYIKNIDFCEARKGNYELCYNKYAPYELSIYDISKIIDDSALDIPRIAIFTDEFKYPAIMQTGKDGISRTWMSVSPNEIFTMQKPIENAHGKVLTLGLGMGYFAYMASLKEDVETVTVIEKEQDVIDLFETHILPQFENRDKIRIIKADAVEYLKNIEDGEYDYCFADIWIGVQDIIPYFSVKEIGRNFRKTKFDYWIEEAFANNLLQYVWLEILSAFYREVGVPVPKLSNEVLGNLEMRKQNYIRRLFRKVEIKTPADVEFYLKPENVIRLIDKTKIIF